MSEKSAAGAMIPPEDVPGQVGVHNETVIVTPPQGDGAHPTISPSSHVQVTVNGKAIDGPTVVYPEDRIELEAISDPAETSVEVHVSDDRMSAGVHILRHPGMQYELQDIPAGSSITVTGRPVKDILPRAVTREEIQQALTDAGVTFGVDDTVIDKLVDARRRMADQEEVAALGRPPTETVDGHIRPQFSESDRTVDVDAKRVDLLDRGHVVSVHQGDILGVWVEAVRGEDGMDVTGRPVLAREPLAHSLHLGEGVSQPEGGLRIVAEKSGRPIIDGTSISVISLHEVSGDVTVETGHVEFDGDVHVKGSLHESLRVRAGGCVVIHGMAAKAARIEAGGDVTVKKNVVGATIEAGGDATIYMQLADLLSKLDSPFEEAVSGASQLVSELERAGRQLPFGQLAKTLFERRFPQAPEAVEEMAAFVKKYHERVDDDLRAAVDELRVALVGRGPLQMSGLGDLAQLGATIAAARSRAEGRADAVADVTVGYLQGAQVTCSGTFIVTGRACYNSHIVAGNGFEARVGVVRGGTIAVAKGDVVVKELGSASAVATEVNVGAGGRIEADVIHSHVKCTIGQRTHRFQEPARRVTMLLDEETGELKF